jgi:PERQ amino acid-rich with GYF domain-containing protein
MSNALLPAVLLVLLVSIASLVVAILILQVSRRLEDLGADRYEFLRDQDSRLKSLREERQILREELERESQERQRLMERLQEVLGKGASQQLIETLNTENVRKAEQWEQERLRLEQEQEGLKEELERERQERLEVQRWAERLEQEREEQLEASQLEADKRLGQERQRLTEDLERERGESLENRQRLEHSEQERLRLEQEQERLKEELDSLKRTPSQPPLRQPNYRRPWWRRPIAVAGMLLGVFVVWLVSLMTALNLLYP